MVKLINSYKNINNLLVYLIKKVDVKPLIFHPIKNIKLIFYEKFYIFY
jgi:hypothetical protein